MTYLLLKELHIGCVVVSGIGFFLRGVAMLLSSPVLQQPVARVLPHIIDSILLASALAMSISSGQYPLVNDWLTAKLIGLLIYIGLGTMALKRARSKRLRALFFVGALTALAYIISVALTRSPRGVLHWIA